MTRWRPGGAQVSDRLHGSYLDKNNTRQEKTEWVSMHPGGSSARVALSDPREGQAGLRGGLAVDVELREGRREALPHRDQRPRGPSPRRSWGRPKPPQAGLPSQATQPARHRGRPRRAHGDDYDFASPDGEIRSDVHRRGARTPKETSRPRRVRRPGGGRGRSGFEACRAGTRSPDTTPSRRCSGGRRCTPAQDEIVRSRDDALMATIESMEAISDSGQRDAALGGNEDADHEEPTPAGGSRP